VRLLRRDGDGFSSLRERFSPLAETGGSSFHKAAGERRNFQARRELFGSERQI
jgi:hypothetical protein